MKIDYECSPKGTRLEAHDYRRGTLAYSVLNEGIYVSLPFDWYPLDDGHKPVAAITGYLLQKGEKVTLTQE